MTDLFLVAEGADQPCFIFQSLHQAEHLLGAEFWETVGGQYVSEGARWVGWHATGPQVVVWLLKLGEAARAVA